jgi:DNA-binding transcriptional LysR family regulator
MTSPDFDWTLMRSFLAVIEAGSLQGAARRLTSTQPTIGRHVMQLEEQLGCALFERTGRKLLPTRAAEAIAEHARQMAEGADAVARALSAAQDAPTGTVRISASQMAACYLLPPMLARVRLAQPALQIELVSTNAVSNPLRREADIAIRMVRPEQSSLIARKVGEVGIGAYASSDYLARRGAPTSPAALVAHDLIGLDEDDTLLRGFAALDTPVMRESFVFRTDDHVACWQAVRAGVGIGFVSHFVAATDPDVRRVLPDLPVPPLPIWLAVHREIRGNTAIRAVYDLLGVYLAEASGTDRRPEAAVLRA